jgi:hypothetical protein
MAKSIPLCAFDAACLFFSSERFTSLGVEWHVWFFDFQPEDMKTTPAHSTPHRVQR